MVIAALVPLRFWATQSELKEVIKDTYPVSINQKFEMMLVVDDRIAKCGDCSAGTSFKLQIQRKRLESEIDDLETKLREAHRNE